MTYYKRKKGLFKKAKELSTLCKVKVAICIVDHERSKASQYGTHNFENIMKEFKELEASNLEVI